MGLPATCSTHFCLFIMGLHDSALIAVPVPVFEGGALVELFFASSQGDFEFDAMAFPIHGDGDTSLALLVGGGGEAREFPFVHE